MRIGVWGYGYEETFPERVGGGKLVAEECWFDGRREGYDGVLTQVARDEIDVLDSAFADEVLDGELQLVLGVGGKFWDRDILDEDLGARERWAREGCGREGRWVVGGWKTKGGSDGREKKKKGSLAVFREGVPLGCETGEGGAAESRSDSSVEVDRRCWFEGAGE